MKLKIYTKTGDKGQTSLYGGKRVGKDDQRVVAYGTVDELNSALGVVVAHVEQKNLQEILLSVQSDLFSIGASLAGNTKQPLDYLDGRISAMEKQIDAMDCELPELKNFILPGGSSVSSFAHLARSICRRAEREVIHLVHQEEVVFPEIIQYLNRLSDFLFVIARYLSIIEGKNDRVWKQT